MPAPSRVKCLEELLDGQAQVRHALDVGPTKLLPGDPRKVGLMRRRLQLGLPPSHPADARLPVTWHWRSRRGSNGRENRWTLHDGTGALVMELRYLQGQWHITKLTDYLTPSPSGNSDSTS